MKSLSTLIRVQRQGLDEMRVRLAQMENRRNSYLAQIEALTEELRTEFALAEHLPDMRGFFGDFSGAIKKKQQRIIASLLKLEKQIQELMFEIQIHYSELKKLEIAKEQCDATQALAQRRKEQQQMDEIGIRTAYVTPL